jgi:hypothetical protein
METCVKFGIMRLRIHPTLPLAHVELRTTKKAIAVLTWLASMQT